MKFLRLTLVSLTALLVATALAAPGFIGPRVEEIWKQQLAQLQGGRVSDYERGWFGAEAGTSVRSGDGTTELRSDIQHGPLLFTAGGPRVGAMYSETRLSVEGLAPALRAQLERLYGRLDHSPLVLESLVAANNRVINTLRLEPFTRSDSGGELEFDGGRVRLETDYSGATPTGTIELGALRWMQKGRERLYTDPLSGEFRIRPGASGDVALALPLLRADSDSGPLEMRDLSLEITAELLRSRKLKLVSDLRAPRIQSATPISSVKQQMTLPQISPADLGHFLRPLLQAPAERNWPRVLRRPLQLQQQLAIQSANGPVLLDADIDWAGIAAGARPVAEAPAQWMEPLTGTATFSAAEQALLQSPLVGQAMTLRKYGLLLEEDGELQMHLQVDRGELQVNGQLLPPDLFLLALSGQF